MQPWPHHFLRKLKGQDLFHAITPQAPNVCVEPLHILSCPNLKFTDQVRKQSMIDPMHGFWVWGLLSYIVQHLTKHWFHTAHSKPIGEALEAFFIR